uniref:Bifunctional NAD(P)H-hydrate repair enzyme n=1 Tax=uncultured miscellaneous Crenarchaeota group TaxID=1368239 RepID=W8RLX5_9ARCH|nr:carbohydrate kinase [uncultured miscellaneous Crenarchaeota group]
MEIETITSPEMRALEINAEYYGVSRLQLMETAGRNVAHEIASRFKPKNTRVAIFCGSGGNGGDGFVAARHLTCLGFEVEVILAGKTSNISDESANSNWLALQPLRNTLIISEVYDSKLIPDVAAEVAVDALLGVGLKGKLRPPILQLVEKINEMEVFRIAVDVPTGINSDSGEVLGNAVKADLTVTFYKAKPGHAKAREYTGELVVRDIGLPPEFERFAGPGDVPLAVKPRLPEAHKGTFGRLLVVGGSNVFSGAPALVAMAALRVGADLVSVAAPEKTAYAISSMSPALITIKMKGKHLSYNNLSNLKEHLESATAIVVGPGLGLHSETKDAIRELVEMVEKTGTPLLLDADGLKAFAEFKRKAELPLVLTPHVREYEILTGRKLPNESEERAEEVQRAARKFGATVLLKGPVDVISNGVEIKFNFTGNPGMTVGGTGDVLSGVVGGLLAMGADTFRAAVAGAFINGAAGDFVRAEKGYHMLPTDLLEWIPHVMGDPMSHLEVRRNQF